MTKQTNQRPPVGVVPRALWLQTRAELLADGIQRYVVAGFIGGEYKQLLEKWIDELEHMLELLNEVDDEDQT